MQQRLVSANEVLVSADEAKLAHDSAKFICSLLDMTMPNVTDLIMSSDVRLWISTAPVGVAEQSRRVVAACLAYIAPGAAYVIALCTAEQYRGQGHATALMRLLTGHIGSKPTYLYAGTRQAAAFYDGFAAQHTLQVSRGTTVQREMRKLEEEKGTAPQLRIGQLISDGTGESLRLSARGGSKQVAVRKRRRGSLSHRKRSARAVEQRYEYEVRPLI